MCHVGPPAGLTSQWLFCEGTTTSQSTEEEMNKEVDRVKDRLYNIVKATYQSPDFALDRDAKGKLGVHSTKKSATTRARMIGVNKDFIDYRARWRNKRMQEIYAMA